MRGREDIGERGEALRLITSSDNCREGRCRFRVSWRKGSEMAKQGSVERLPYPRASEKDEERREEERIRGE